MAGDMSPACYALLNMKNAPRVLILCLGVPWVTDFCLPRKFCLHGLFFFSSSFFVSHSPLVLFCKFSPCQNPKVKTCIKWLAGVPLGSLRNVMHTVHWNLWKSFHQLKLGLWSHVLHLSVRASYGCEMFCSYIFRVLKPYFYCVAFSDVLGYSIPQKLYKTNLTDFYCGVFLSELGWNFCGLLKMSIFKTWNLRFSIHLFRPNLFQDIFRSKLFHTPWAKTSIT